MSESDKSSNTELPEMKRENIPIISKPSDGVSEVPGAEGIDHVVLKQRQTTAVGKVIRKRNDLVKLKLRRPRNYK